MFALNFRHETGEQFFGFACGSCGAGPGTDRAPHVFFACGNDEPVVGSDPLPPSAQGLCGWREKVDRAEKTELVTHYNGIFNNAGVIVVTHYSGLTVADISKFRNQMAEVGGTVKVTKNRLVKLALAGTPAEVATDLFVGPTAIAYSDDPVAAPRVAAKFAKENNNLVILGGVMDGSFLDADGVKTLASLPSLDELRGKLVGLLNAPATKIAGVLQAPAGQIARVISAKAAQGEAA